MSDLLESTMKDLHDRRVVEDLVNRLGACLDGGRFDEMVELLDQDATARTPGGEAEGRDAVIAQARRNHRVENHIQHVITNVVVDLEGDHGRVRANHIAYFAPPGSGDVAPLVAYTLGGIYHLELVRHDDGWRITRIETEPVWSSGSREAVAPPA